MHQRGWGRSSPLGGLEGNTVAAIIGDLEAVREELDIERCVHVSTLGSMHRTRPLYHLY